MKNNKPSLLHQRTINLNGFLIEDDLYQLEAELLDTKNYDVPNYDRGNINAGDPIHKMKIVLTVDKQFYIKKAKATTFFSPFKACNSANNNFKMLEGIQIKHGWRKNVNEIIGNVNGCTHIRELLNSLATVAFQTIHGHNSKKDRDDKKENNSRKYQKNNKEQNSKKPSLLSSCFAFRPNSKVVKRLWPEWYKE